MTKPTIYFDIDGTLASTYEVENWLEKLRAGDPTPYTDAKPMHDFRVLARFLNKLQRQGYNLGIITWLSKGSTQFYGELVRKRKKEWLNTHLKSVSWNEVHIVKYGTPKHLVAKDRNGILFDDNIFVRAHWKGEAYNETEIFKVLNQLRE